MSSTQVSERQKNIPNYSTKPNHFPTAFECYPKSMKLIVKTNQQAEKLAKILFLVIVKMTFACGAVPWIICTYFIYFTTNLGPEAFVLPAATW